MGWVSKDRYTSIDAVVMDVLQEYRPADHELIVADGPIPPENKMERPRGARMQDKAYLWLYDGGILSVVFIAVSLTFPDSPLWMTVMGESEGPIAPPSNRLLALPVTKPNREWRHSIPFFPQRAVGIIPIKA